MKNQKIVEIENGHIHRMWDGTFDTGYGEQCQTLALEDLLKCGGFDYKDHIGKLEKTILGLLNRNPKDRVYIEEMMGEEWLEGNEAYYSSSVIKTRTAQEKEELIQKIREDKY
jgi:hypothetical protein